MDTGPATDVVVDLKELADALASEDRWLAYLDARDTPEHHRAINDDLRALHAYYDAEAIREHERLVERYKESHGRLPGRRTRLGSPYKTEVMLARERVLKRRAEVKALIRENQEAQQASFQYRPVIAQLVVAIHAHLDECPAGTASAAELDRLLDQIQIPRHDDLATLRFFVEDGRWF